MTTLDVLVVAHVEPHLAHPGHHLAGVAGVDAIVAGRGHEEHRRIGAVGPHQKVEITADDRWKGKGAHSRLPVGAKLTRGDLLRLALMASENRAALVLARNYPGGKAAFVRTMNVKAKALGMTKTRFDDPSGLSSLNVSSARDLAKLLNVTSRDTRIREFSTLPSHEVRAGRSVLGYRNTNLLVGKPDWNILVQKTGFTNDAGECLVMQAMIGERPVNLVLLNSFGKLTRTADARRIRKWMEAQSEQTMAGAGAAKRNRGQLPLPGKCRRPSPLM